MGNIGKKIMDSSTILNSLGVIGFLGIVWLVIYGNVGGNLGFTEGTAGYNNTQSVIDNATTGFTGFFDFVPTLFNIAGVVLLLVMLVGLLLLVMSIAKKASGGKGKGGFE